MKPIIGILGSNMYFPAPSFAPVEKFYVNTSYINAVQLNGGIPLAIPVCENEEDLAELLKMCNGVIVPGGEDVDPKYFNESPHPTIGVIRPDMDKFIFQALDICFKHNIPLFGICRGLQIINIALGGSLYQDMSLYEKDTILHRQTYDRSYTVHKADIKSGSLLHSIFGKEEIMVNTMHHQAIKDLGQGLCATALAPDDIIEAIESDDRPILAVQWHPEELIRSTPDMNKLFSHFIINMAAKHNPGF